MEAPERHLEVTERPRVPWDGAVLAWGAMLPLGACAAVAVLGDAPAAELARTVARLWGAALLLFFSGVRRGLSFRTEGGPKLAQLLAFATLFVAGLAVLLLPVGRGLGLLVLAFAGLAVEDTRAARRAEAPLYFSRLRPWQMGFGMVAAGLCGWAG